MCVRSCRFEAQQAVLHQQLLLLQDELAATRRLYDSLLEQVGQQGSFIQQLSEQETPGEEEGFSLAAPSTGESGFRPGAAGGLDAPVTRPVVSLHQDQDRVTEAGQKTTANS